VSSPSARGSLGRKVAESDLRIQRGEEAGMKLWVLILAALLIQGSARAAQENKAKSQNRPTLGPEPGGAPTLSGPHNSTTNDARRLLRVHTLYVERIDNNLSDKLISAFAKAGRFRVTDKRDEADAVLRGTCFDSRHLKVVHTEIFIADRLTGSPIWQDIIHQPYGPPPLREAVNATALAVLKHLAESVAEAERQ
jgi:hypothetical protein